MMKLSILFIAGCLFSVAWLFTSQDSTANAFKARDAVSAQAAFAEAYKVFMHPRCVNCHPAGDAPLRGEDSQPHSGLRLRRGVDGRGVLTLKCTNCHQSNNQQGLHMPPGAPNVLSDGSLDLTTPRWRLPSAKTPMIFQGRTAAELCRQLKSPQENGGLSAERLIHHVSNDPLVLWGWNPGEGRTTPPLTHDQFVASVREWLDNGGACPK
jgi:hypothetical protein